MTETTATEATDPKQVPPPSDAPAVSGGDWVMIVVSALLPTPVALVLAGVNAVRSRWGVAGAYAGIVSLHVILLASKLR